MGILEQVIVQVDEERQFPNPSLCAAFLGFRARGCDVITRTASEIEALEAVPQTLVFGGVEVVRPYLRRLGREPAPLDYPEELHPYLGRQVTQATLGHVRAMFGEQDEIPGVFIKPVEHKLFPGQLVHRFADLIGTASFPPSTPVYMTYPKPFASEWRVYLHRGAIVGVAHYRGDPCQFVDIEFVRRCIRAFVEIPDAPCAGSLDLGTDVYDGNTWLVEVNDMICLGSYGLAPTLYATLIEARWEQLVCSGV